MGCCSFNRDREYKGIQKAQSYVCTEEGNQKMGCGETYDDTIIKIILDFSMERCQSGHTYNIFCEIPNYQNPFKSEKIFCNSSKIKFSSRFICDYYTSRAQNIRIDIYRDNIILNRIFTSLREIVGSSIYSAIVDSNNGEQIIIKTNILNNPKSSITFSFSADKSKKIDFSALINKFSFVIKNNNRIIYKSESLSNNGTFESKKIPSGLLMPNFDIIFLNYTNKTLYSIKTTIDEFEQMQNSIIADFYITPQNKIYVRNNSNSTREYTVTDYLKNGVQINLVIAIDFTSINLNQMDYRSLHSIVNGRPNNYERAIQACGYIVAYFDYDRLFPVYGFGAKIGNTGNTSHCFNLNFKNDPNIYTIGNVIKEYHNCLQKIQFSKPSFLSPVINQTIKNIKNNHNDLEYTVLMILTNGMIDDLQPTIDALVEGSFLPLSVVIIGIGEFDYSKMITLDGDDLPITSSKGVKRMRDLVQFVPFSRYENNPRKLAEQVLEEIPRQFLDYYKMKQIFPENLKRGYSSKENRY